MLIVTTALAFGHWMTQSGIPARLVHFAVGHGFATWQFLLAINLLLLGLGCFLEVTATLLLVLPILAPVLQPLGVDPVHFSIIFTHNMEIGLVHHLCARVDAVAAQPGVRSLMRSRRGIGGPGP
jgi:C4-dicarboxylate transporter DctM subunit